MNSLRLRDRGRDARFRAPLPRSEGEIRDQRSFPHSGDGLAGFCDWLMRLRASHPENTAVAIEVSHGAVVDTMTEREFAVFAINPKQLDRFWDRFIVAGAKDDRRDALILASSLRIEPRCFRRLRDVEPAIVELREWSCGERQLRLPVGDN